MMPYREGDRWRAGVMVNGVRSETRLCATKKEALDFEAEQRKKLKKNAKISPAGPDLLTICSRYIVYSERFSPKTYQEKKAACDRLLSYLSPDRPAESIEPSEIENYLEEQRRLRSANAANKDRKNLAAMWGKAVKTWGVTENPVVATEPFPHDRAPQYTPPTRDVLRVLAAATRREKVFLLAYLYTGARRSEVFRWRWDEDINFEQRAYRLGTKKTKTGDMSYEWFPLPEDLCNELRWLYHHRVPKRYKLSDQSVDTLRKSPWVFPNYHPHRTIGQPYTQRRWFMRELCDRAKVPHFGYHALRRFFASRLKDLGKGTKTIQRLLRHNSITTTERYIQSLNDDLTGTADQILHMGFTRKEKEAADDEPATS